MKALVALFSVFSIGMGLASCGGTTGGQESSLAEVSENSEFARVNVARITFTKWEDVVRLDIGMLKVTNADATVSCAILDPAAERTSDGSSRWSPLHSYWAIRGAARSGDVREYREVFFAGDVVSTQSIGEPASTLRGISDLNATFVDISDIKLNANRTIMTGKLGVVRIPYISKLLVQTKLVDGQCTAQALRCVTNGCNPETAEGYKAFKRVHISQGLLGMPTDMSFL